MMDTLAGTFSHLGEMSSKTDGSTSVGLWVKSENSMLILIKLTFNFSFFSVDFHFCLRWSLVPMTLRSLTGLSIRSN